MISEVSSGSTSALQPNKKDDVTIGKEVIDAVNEGSIIDLIKEDFTQYAKTDMPRDILKGLLASEDQKEAPKEESKKETGPLQELAGILFGGLIEILLNDLFQPKDEKEPIRLAKQTN